MSVEIAKASIDYANKNSGDKIAITFYGGEPLLRFDLLKMSIDYALNTISGKELSFSLTTNLTLLTQEMAEYLASIPHLSVVCSIDGPENVHNECRVYMNEEGSFNSAYRGLIILANAFKSNSTNSFSINSVLTPPYNYEKLNKINEFFKSLDFLQPNTNINISYASDGSINKPSGYNEMLDNPKYVSKDGMINPLWEWQKINVDLTNDIYNGNSIYSTHIAEALSKIHYRYLSASACNNFSFNGCCVPGARRLYINTKGELYICEKIGNSPSIGNILTGIDLNILKEKYITEYSEKSAKYCSECWAVRLCHVCYAQTHGIDGIDMERKNRYCAAVRNQMEAYLSLYHHILETSPTKLNFLKEMVLI